MVEVAPRAVHRRLRALNMFVEFHQGRRGVADVQVSEDPRDREAERNGALLNLEGHLPAPLQR